MKITSIRAVQVNLPRRAPSQKARRPAWQQTAEVATPMSRYPHVKRHRSSWTNTGWGRVF